MYGLHHNTPGIVILTAATFRRHLDLCPPSRTGRHTLGPRHLGRGGLDVPRVAAWLQLLATAAQVAHAAGQRGQLHGGGRRAQHMARVPGPRGPLRSGPRGRDWCSRTEEINWLY